MVFLQTAAEFRLEVARDDVPRAAVLAVTEEEIPQGVSMVAVEVRRQRVRTPLRRLPGKFLRGIKRGDEPVRRVVHEERGQAAVEFTARVLCLRPPPPLIAPDIFIFRLVERPDLAVVVVVLEHSSEVAKKAAT